jgi:hypothetical protein
MVLLRPAARERDAGAVRQNLIITLDSAISDPYNWVAHGEPWGGLPLAALHNGKFLVPARALA